MQIALHKDESTAWVGKIVSGWGLRESSFDQERRDFSDDYTSQQFENRENRAHSQGELPMTFAELLILVLIAAIAGAVGRCPNG